MKIHAVRKRPITTDQDDEGIKVNKSLLIPKDVDRDKIQAHIEDGVLYLALPKQEQAKPKKIKISQAGQDTTWSKLLDSFGKKDSN